MAEPVSRFSAPVSYTPHDTETTAREVREIQFSPGSYRGQQGSAGAAGGRLAGGWTPTVDGYLGRVTKARILQAVRDAKGEPAAERIAPLKKGEMAEQAEALLAGSGWLPEPLRAPGQVFAVTAEAPDAAEAAQPIEPDQPEAEAPGGVDGEAQQLAGDPEQHPVEPEQPEVDVTADEEWPTAAE